MNELAERLDKIHSLVYKIERNHLCDESIVDDIDELIMELEEFEIAFEDLAIESRSSSEQELTFFILKISSTTSSV